MEVYYNPHEEAVRIGPHQTEEIPADSFLVFRTPPYDEFYKHIMDELVRTGRLEHFVFQMITKEDPKLNEKVWPDWVIVESAVFCTFADKMRWDGGLEGRHITVRQNRVVNELARYLKEKLPHQHLIYSEAGGCFVMTCIPNLSLKMWEKVLLPELKQWTKRKKANIYYMQTREKGGKCDLKMFVVWDCPGDVFSLVWQDVREYFDMPKFTRWLMANPEYYTQYHTAI